MRKSALLLTVSLGVFVMFAVAIAQVQELPNVPLVTSGWHEKFWSHKDGTKFHYLEMGSGTPVILIHGSGGTALNWMMNGLGASIARPSCARPLDSSSNIRRRSSRIRTGRVWRSTISGSWASRAAKARARGSRSAAGGTSPTTLCGPINNEMMDRSHPRCHRPKHVQNARNCTGP